VAKNQKSKISNQQSTDRPLQHRGLVALGAVAKIEVEPGADLPTRINVAPWGTHTTPKGRVVINETTARALPANQQASNLDRVALDFNHNTVPDSESYRGEPAEIAAMAVPSIVPGEGIIFDQIEWTPEGKHYVGNKHYVDLSPTLALNNKGEALLIHSAAVCRTGAIPGLELFSTDPLKRSNASPPQRLKMDPYKQLLCEMLGLDPEAATDDQIKSGLTAFAAKVKTGADAATKFSAFEEKVNSFSANSAKVSDLESKLTTLSTTVQEIQERSETSERASIIQEATLQGKVIPKSAVEGEGALSNVQLKALCAELPVTVPMERRTFATQSAESGAVVSNSADEEVKRNLGISDEQWKKFNA
jgi:phage I-like protein